MDDRDGKTEAVLEILQTSEHQPFGIRGEYIVAAVDAEEGDEDPGEWEVGFDYLDDAKVRANYLIDQGAATVWVAYVLHVRCSTEDPI